MNGQWTEEELLFLNIWFPELGLQRREVVCKGNGQKWTEVIREVCGLKSEFIFQTFGFGSVD